MRAIIDVGKSGMRLSIDGEQRVAQGVLPAGATSSEGVEQFLEHIVSSLGSDAPRLTELAIGSTFKPVGAGLARLQDGLAEALPLATIWVGDDGVLAHAAALGGPGVVIAAGTGVAVVAVLGDQLRRVDGWGDSLGDRGGAVNLGQEGLRAVFRVIDEVGPPTTLLEAARDRHGELDLDFAFRLYSSERLMILADFARAVLQCAAQGDQVARELVRASAHDLVRSANAAVRGSAAPVVVVGRLGLDPTMREFLIEAVNETLLSLVPPRDPPLSVRWDVLMAEPYRSAAWWPIEQPSGPNDEGGL